MFHEIVAITCRATEVVEVIFRIGTPKQYISPSGTNCEIKPLILIIYKKITN